MFHMPTLSNLMPQEKMVLLMASAHGTMTSSQLSEQMYGVTCHIDCGQAILRTNPCGRSTQAQTSQLQGVGACVDHTRASGLTFIPRPYLIVQVKSLRI